MTVRAITTIILLTLMVAIVSSQIPSEPAEIKEAKLRFEMGAFLDVSWKKSQRRWIEWIVSVARLSYHNPSVTLGF